jgi:hypothetical protein
MTVAQPEIPLTERRRSLEVRWILPGQLEAAMTRWFARFRAGVESREDGYLADPQLPGLSVKLRNGSALEVKMYQGSPGTLEVAGRARGRLESWGKWSFPCDPLSQGGADLRGWRPVRKLIRRFALASGQRGPQVPRLGQEPGCEVELTEVRVHGQAWWTLAFEATGPASLLRRDLEATAVAYRQPGAQRHRRLKAVFRPRWTHTFPLPSKAGEAIGPPCSRGRRPPHAAGRGQVASPRWRS